MPGTLFVVATPIGNLEDLTFRALRILREVDRIAAEDTRRTSKLLAHYEVQKPLVSLHEHNEARESAQLVDRLIRGEHIALVSDAGTPGISDPGQYLVAAARIAGVPVVPVPGPSAVTAALSVSGLPGTTFTFMGFPPSSGLARQTWFDSLCEVHGRIVFFESPHRFQRTIQEVSYKCVERPIFVAREISKIHEELVIWDNNAIIRPKSESKGEFVVVLGELADSSTADVDVAQASRLIGLLTDTLNIDEPAALRATSAILELPVPRVRKAIKKARILERRTTETDPG